MNFTERLRRRKTMKCLRATQIPPPPHDEYSSLFAGVETVFCRIRNPLFPARARVGACSTTMGLCASDVGHVRELAGSACGNGLQQQGGNRGTVGGRPAGDHLSLYFTAVR